MGFFLIVLGALNLALGFIPPMDWISVLNFAAALFATAVGIVVSR